MKVLIPVNEGTSLLPDITVLLQCIVHYNCTLPSLYNSCIYKIETVLM